MSDTIPPGYKRTEVGVIPEDWEIDIISNLVSITTGDKNTQDNVEDGKYPFFVRSANIERINSYTFDGEAVLTAGDGVGTGKIFHYIDGKFDFHQRVYKISEFTNSLDGYFFYLYFSTHFYDRIMSMTAKSSVDSVRMEMIAGMQIPLPSLAEQRAIADALREVNAEITALDAAIAKKRDLKQGAMQRLLTGEERLPGFSGAWEVKRLGALSEVKTGPFGAQLHESDYVSQGTPIITVEHLGEFGVKIDDTVPMVSDADKLRLSQYILRKDDIVFSRVGSIDRNSLIGEREDGWLFSGRLLRVRLLADVDAAFLSYCFHGEDFKNKVKSVAVGQTMPSLNTVILSNIEVFLPLDREEQRAIAAVLSDMNAEIAALEAEREKTVALKGGMMQNLLTGKVRLV